jgi:ribonuclease-3
MKNPERKNTDQEIIEIIGERINSVTPYRNALHHSSIFRSKVESGDKLNKEEKDRLEYVGKHFLSYEMSKVLFDLFDDFDGSKIAKSHSELTSNSSVARYAEHIGLSDYIVLSRNAFLEDVHENPKILSSSYKALLGAILTDLGESNCRRFLQDNVVDPFPIRKQYRPDKHPKSKLLELVQAKGMSPPEYSILNEGGPAHAKVFTVQVSVEGNSMGSGTADSKSKAEKHAAQDALQNFQI